MDENFPSPAKFPFYGRLVVTNLVRSASRAARRPPSMTGDLSQLFLYQLRKNRMVVAAHT